MSHPAPLVKALSGSSSTCGLLACPACVSCLWRHVANRLDLNPRQGHSCVSRHFHVSCRSHHRVSFPRGPLCSGRGEHACASRRGNTTDTRRTVPVEKGLAGMRADTSTTRQVDAYPVYAASAIAANTFVRCSFAGKWEHERLSPAQPDTLGPTLGRVANSASGNQPLSPCSAYRCMRSSGISGPLRCSPLSRWPCFPSPLSSSGTGSRYDAEAGTPRYSDARQGCRRLDEHEDEA